MRALALGVLTVLAGCDGCFSPKHVCIPVSCAYLQRNCGPIDDDGCGHALYCGDCPTGQTCGALIANVCDKPPVDAGWVPTDGCTPLSCAALNANCGQLGDGCGSVIDCGICTNGTCTAHQCSGCAPPACPGPDSCGMVTNPCGQQISCGSCMNGMLCGPNNQCVCPGGSCTLAPPRLALAGVWFDHVDLTWSQTSGAVGSFMLERSDNMGPFIGLPVQPGPSSRFTDSSVVPTFFVQYRVTAVGAGGTVSSPSNTVSAFVPPRASAWRTSGGDRDHSSANLVETARPPGTLQWERVFDGGTVSGVAVEPPIAFVVVQQPAATALLALELDGGNHWSAGLGQPASFSHPSVFNGHTFVNVARPAGIGEVDGFDNNGQPIWTFQVPIMSSPPLPAPISTGDSVLSNPGATGALLSMPQDGPGTPSSAPVTPPDVWTPTLAGGQVWLLSGPMLDSVDLVSFTSTSMPTPLPPGPPLSDEWIAASGGLLVMVSGPSMFAFAPPSPMWMSAAPKPFVAPPALALGMAIAPTVDSVEVHDVMSGNPLASLPTDGGLAFPPVVAAGVVYVSSNTTVFAFDLMSKQLLWTTTPGGRLSVAQGTLYVAGGDRVRAYALTP